MCARCGGVSVCMQSLQNINILLQIYIFTVVVCDFWICGNGSFLRHSWRNVNHETTHVQRKRECHDRAVDTLQASSRHLEPQRSIVVFHCIATREAAYSNHIQVSTTTITTTSRHCLCAQSLDCCISRFIETKYIWPFYKLNNTFPLSPSLSLCISFCISICISLSLKRGGGI